MEHPVISALCGRLGNCLSQIATGLSYAKKIGRPFRFYPSDSRSNSKDYAPILSRFSKIGGLPDVADKWNEPNDYSFREIPTDFREDKPIILKGYFQNERYYDKDLVLNAFKAPEGVEESVIKKYGDLSDCVSINVRRGDYVDLKHALDAKWYEDAYNKFFKGQKAFICSDDIRWCEENINIPNAIFSDETSVMEDLYGGALCKNHLSYNGSFGWWVCYLGEKEDSIIVIKKDWFKDLPNKWIEE